MPTNVTPEYKKAQAEFRKAREPADRLACLKEMLRTLPKHKGTEHLQADIKSRIKELTAELQAPKKGAGRTGPLQTVRPEGAAQVALVGPPNSGKSSLHASLTGSHAEIGPYPFTTHTPLPGMLAHEDVHFQLVDLPPISAEFMEPWMPNALQPAHAALLVVDLSAPGCVEDVAAIRERLQQKRITLEDEWEGGLGHGFVQDGDTHEPVADEHAVAGGPADEASANEEFDDPFRVQLPTLLVASKCDLNHDPEEIAVLEELADVRYPAVAVSSKTGEGLDRLGALLFKGLGVVRVYTKAPGRPPDKDRPYTVFRGDTVLDIAQLVHRDLAESLRFARIWGSAKFDGQQVGKDHRVSDGDIVELHV